MKEHKVPAVASYHIYGKVSNRQVRFELYNQQKGFGTFGDIPVTLPYKVIAFNTLLQVFNQGHSYLQTKHLRTLIFYGILNIHKKLPRINYYAFPDK